MTAGKNHCRSTQIGTGSGQRLRAGAERLRAWGRRGDFSVGKCLGWLLTLAVTAVAAQPLPPTLLAIDFDQLAQGVLPPGVSIKTQFKAPDVVPGVVGSAWRCDGFSSYAEANLALDPQAGFGISLWVALESFPADREVPVRELSPSSFIQQAAGDAGFDLHIDAYGRWGFRLGTSAGLIRIAAPQRFPLRQWVQLLASVNTQTGQVALYQDGNLVGSANGQPGMVLRLAPVPLRLATPAVEAKILDFRVNRLNAAFDQVAVYGGPLAPAQLAQLSGPKPGQAPDATASLRVPESRFSSDWLRPAVHPMPPANWTNEPHGLVRVGNGGGDDWHLFYQRTPNGPYKTLMHWGHMVSRDLVDWQHLPDALWPELQTADFGFDMKGIWSGHVIVDGGKAFAFYTSVNHGDRIAGSNPGIAMAVSEDAQLRDWRKLGPILNSQGVKDFRDPFVWKDSGSLHMIVGAALETGGGLAYYVLQPGEQGARWQPRARFTEPGYRLLDPGSEIWEMPVFERLSDQVSILVVNPIGGKFSKYGAFATRAVYWTGEWSGGVFKPFFREPKPLDLLPGHLAPTVARAADGRLRAIGIIDERRSPRSQEFAGWAHTFSLPRVWSLLPDQRTLGQAPAPELQALRGERRLAQTGLRLGAEQVKLELELHAYELLLELEALPAGAGTISIDVLASADGQEFTRLLFDPVKGSVSIDRSHATLSSEVEGPALLQGAYASEAFGAMRTLRVVVDGSTIEVFVNDAAAYAVRSYPSRSASTQLRLSASGGPGVSANLQLWPLRRPT